jgi:hypothetical protein
MVRVNPTQPKETSMTETTCRTLADVLAAADRDAASDPPLSQAQADLIAALLAPHRAQDN